LESDKKSLQYGGKRQCQGAGDMKTASHLYSWEQGRGSMTGLFQKTQLKQCLMYLETEKFDKIGE
jgi:hypothetical protein